MVPNGWLKKHLSDVASFSQGIQVPIEGQYAVERSNTCRFLRISDFVNRDEEPRFIDTPDSKFIVEPHDLSMVRYGSAGAGDLVRGLSGAIANNLFRVIPDESTVSKEYLWIYLRQEKVKSFLFSGSTSSTMPAVSFKLVGKVPVPVPPLPEQQKIAKILSTWDKAIATTEKLIATSQQQKKALMQQLLTGKKRLLNPETGMVFEGDWEEVKLSQCSTCLDNKRVPLNGEQRSERQGSYPYWGANGIVDYVNDFIFDETIVLLAEDGGYFDEYATRPIANISYGKCWVNNHAHIIRAKKNATNEWLYFSLVHKNILAFINGGTRAKLNKKDMLLIKVLLPSIKEQQKIASVLTATDKEIELLQAKLAHLKEEKKALMQQLLTGKRRVKIEHMEEVTC